MKNIISPAVIALSLALGTQATTASPASEAFEDFQTHCAAPIANGAPLIMDGLQAIPARENRRILAALGTAAGEADHFQIWRTSSRKYLLITWAEQAEQDVFCQMVGVGVDFAEMRPAFLEWQETHAKDYTADSPFELAAHGPPSHVRTSAGVFMARPTDDGGVLQLTVQYHPDVLNGFASVLLIRLPVMSPAAREVLQEK